jgi:UrcA family protein
MKILSIAFAALALLPLQAQAEAAPRGTAATVRVSYADLDLASEAGLRTLDRRLAAAARAVCADSAAESLLAPQLNDRRCIAETRQSLAAARERVLATRSAPAFLAVASR